MNTPTLSQLADIGAAAACDTIHGGAIAIDPGHRCYETERLAREAFVQAVLDAVGYKLPVDPEREAYEKWAQQEGTTAGLFEAFKAGRAAILAEQVAHEVVMPHPDSAKPAPETFEAYGLTWFKHTPGDPCPCDEDARVDVLEREEAEGRGYIAISRKACNWRWDKQRTRAEVVGWRYATPTADAP